jgi:DNA helicase-2/ATP-dependent DNA helicase PcrA
MEETLFPSQMAMDSPRGLEEERRLFYVAITRAEEYLVITNARSRFRYGKTEFCEPSRFLREIDPRFLQVRGSGATGTSARGASVPSHHSVPRKDERAAASSIPRGIDARRYVKVTPALLQSKAVQDSALSSSAYDTIAVGTRILHDRFGKGVVTAVSGSGIDTKATVNFENVGVKQLLLRFAKFTRLEEDPPRTSL